MMKRMLTQPVLALLPEDAVEIVPGVGIVTGGDGGGLVLVHGLATFAWDAGDEAGRRLAAVQLVRLRAAAQVQVASAFGVDAGTVWRWDKAVSEGGVGALVPAKRGPKEATKLTAGLAERVTELHGRGLTLAQVAAATGVSTFTVRNALGRVPGRGRLPASGELGGQPGQEAASAAEDEVSEAGDDWPGDDGEPYDLVSGPAGDEDREQQERLPVLPDPVPRDAERVLSRFGLLGEGAGPVFRPGARYPLAGLLLVLPALQATGLLSAAREVYGQLRNGYYGLTATLLTMVFLALTGEPRAEGATRVPPPALGRVLGLDRAPEVKTIRRKLAELASAGKAHELVIGLAERHAAARPDALGFLYADGHARAYFGTRGIQKTHVARLKFPAPATEETWVTDCLGGPVLVVVAEPSASLAGQVRAILPDLRQVVGAEAKVTICFDRGGWSPALFADIIDARFDFLTWRKAPAPDVPASEFSAIECADDRGRRHSWEVADTSVELTINDGPHKGRRLELRQVSRKVAARGGATARSTRQIHMLTTRRDVEAGEACWRMTSRWREENYFRYGRTHYALDALDSYAAAPDDPDRMVPNPAKKTAAAEIRRAEDLAGVAEAERDARLAAIRNPPPGTASCLTNPMINALNAPVDRAWAELDAAVEAAAEVPARIPLADVSPEMMRLETEVKQITHAIRMAAFNAETTLAAALDGCYSRAGDEAHALVREALQISGDIIPSDGVLTIRLDPLTAPRRTAALAQLCEHATRASACYPGTDLILRYEAKPHPGIA
jgi:transposase